MNYSLIAKLLANNAVKFVSFTYRAKGSNELARHTILINASLKKAYEKDLEKLKETLVSLSNPLQIEACKALIKSLENSLEKGIGNNDKYTQKGHWNHPFKGYNSIAFNPETNELQIRGRSMQKKVLEAGEHKKVNSRPLTIEKKKLEKELAKSSFRSYSFSQINSARIDGETLILD